VRIAGTVVGALLMQLIRATLIAHDLPDSSARMIEAAIIVAAGFIQRGGAWIGLVLMLIIGSIVFPDFASSTNFRNIAIQSSFLALAAIGMTFVIVGAGSDLSVGSMLALGSVLAAYGSCWGSAGALPLPLVACASLGLINGIPGRAFPHGAVHRHARSAARGARHRARRL